MSQVMIVVEFEVKPEHRSQFIDLMRGHAERSRRDDGCLQFDLMLPKDDDKHVFLVEKWRDQEALDAHAKGPMPGNTYKDWIVGRKVALRTADEIAGRRRFRSSRSRFFRFAYRSRQRARPNSATARTRASPRTTPA